MATTYRYPLNVTTETSTLPTDAMSRGQTTDYLVIYVLDTSNPSEGFNPYANLGKGKKNSVNWSSEGFVAGTIYLHMPNQIQSNYQITYKDVDMGVLGATAMAAVESGSAPTAESIQAAAASMAPEVAAASLATAIGAANSAVGASGSMTGGDIATLTKRKAFNPYKENVFQSVPFRQHSFNVKMVPRNKDEADQIKGIVNLLKWAMHPSFSAAGEGAGISATRWLDIPYSFGLEYKRIGSSSSQLLYKFMPSVLTAFNVDYTPDGNYVSGRNLTDFNDHGLAVNIQMTFKETRMLTKDVLSKDNSSITY